MIPCSFPVHTNLKKLDLVFISGLGEGTDFMQNCPAEKQVSDLASAAVRDCGALSGQEMEMEICSVAARMTCCPLSFFPPLRHPLHLKVILS